MTSRFTWCWTTSANALAAPSARLTRSEPTARQWSASPRGAVFRSGPRGRVQHGRALVARCNRGNNRRTARRCLLMTERRRRGSPASSSGTAPDDRRSCRCHFAGRPGPVRFCAGCHNCRWVCEAHPNRYLARRSCLQLRRDRPLKTRPDAKSKNVPLRTALHPFPFRGTAVHAWH
jgi:hypothetical protein